jgi:aspartyl protease family protein
MKMTAVRPLFWILLFALGGLALFLLQQNGNGFGELIGIDSASTQAKIAAVIIAGLLAFALSRQRFSQALRSLLVWGLIVLALALGYTYRLELGEVADRVLAAFVPGHAVSKGRTVEITRGLSGGFSVSAQINGARVPMVLDTGASAVVLTPEAAKAAGLPLEVLNYSVFVETANGRARAAPVKLDRISIGGITERSVPALIAQPGQLRTNLLGMSFLDRLESWEVRGDRLLLRGYP